MTAGFNRPQMGTVFVCIRLLILQKELFKSNQIDHILLFVCRSAFEVVNDGSFHFLQDLLIVLLQNGLFFMSFACFQNIIKETGFIKFSLLNRVAPEHRMN